MLTVLIETRNDEEALTRTLASLVSGAVEGVVREVIVCDHGSTDHTHGVAEHAGCRFVADDGIAEAMRLAKGDWLLLLEPGARLLEGWMEPVLAHVAGETRPARFTPARGGRARFLNRIFRARRRLADGLLVTKRQALAGQGSGGGEALARRLSPRRLAARIAAADRRPARA
jgi:glycosyltransferase involved in cell wall biosynthesis